MIFLYLRIGHGGAHKVPKCGEIKLDAISTDDTGKTYAFIGNNHIIHIPETKLLNADSVDQ